jgi:hypothetical protein
MAGRGESKEVRGEVLSWVPAERSSRRTASPAQLVRQDEEEELRGHKIRDERACSNYIDPWFLAEARGRNLSFPTAAAVITADPGRDHVRRG